jgi:hypothetical protein
MTMTEPKPTYGPDAAPSPDRVFSGPEAVKFVVVYRHQGGATKYKTLLGALADVHGVDRHTLANEVAGVLLRLKVEAKTKGGGS